MATGKTREEVDILKERWKRNPNGWKLQDKEGYEEHRAELTAFSEEMHEVWRSELEAKNRQIMLSKRVADMTIYEHYAALAMQALIAKGGAIEDVVREAHGMAFQMATFKHIE
jgi:hypothetical protein